MVAHIDCGKSIARDQIIVFTSSLPDRWWVFFSLFSCISTIFDVVVLMVNYRNGVCTRCTKMAAAFLYFKREYEANTCMYVSGTRSRSRFCNRTCSFCSGMQMFVPLRESSLRSQRNRVNIFVGIRASWRWNGIFQKHSTREIFSQLLTFIFHEHSSGREKCAVKCVAFPRLTRKWAFLAERKWEKILFDHVPSTILLQLCRKILARCSKKFQFHRDANFFHRIFETVVTELFWEFLWCA